MAAVGALPVGKIKAAKKAADKLEELIENRRLAGDAAECAVKAGKHSFPAGTRVLMGDRTTRPIEQVGIGDYVLATNPENGVTGPRRVDGTIYTPDDRVFTDITLDRSAGDSLTTTDHHPFWAENAKRWKDAADLTPQDVLRTADGASARINSVRHWSGLTPAYNLTVNDLHTYYVLAGETPVLVHNSNGLCGTAALENGDWQHILDRHRPGGALVDAKAGIFTGKAKHVRQRIAETINRGTPKPNTPDPETGRPRAGQIYEWDFGVPVGRAGPANGGGELTGIRVIVNDGKVVTAFPF
jgi:hypothetical protein